MSKSTPISQLPIAPQQQQMFVNDQQRQMVNQAQQAQQNFQMPQNTSTSEVQEDESAVLEVLSQLNTSVQAAVPLPPPPPPQVQQMQPQLAEMWRDAYAAAMPEQVEMPEQKSTSSIVPFMNNNDLMLAIYVVVAVILVNFIPIDRAIGRYVAIDKIPFSDLMIKALLAGVLVLLMKHFLK